MTILADRKVNDVRSNGHWASVTNRNDSLRVIDNRTGLEYIIPIEHNAVSATAFREMKCPRSKVSPCDQDEYGLRLFDPGYQNTCVSVSKITYKWALIPGMISSLHTDTDGFSDGLKGLLFYRGYDIGDLVARKGFLDTQYLLLWGHLPSSEEQQQWQRTLASTPNLPQSVHDVILSFQ